MKTEPSKRATNRMIEFMDMESIVAREKTTKVKFPRFPKKV